MQRFSSSETNEKHGSRGLVCRSGIHYKKGEIVSRTDQESEQTAFSANEKNFQKLLRKLISFPVTKSL